MTRTAAARISAGTRNEVVSTRRRAGRPAASGKAAGNSATLVRAAPAERVDRLVGVAGHGEVAVGPVEALQEAGLGDGGVLVLVDQHVAELAGHGCGHRRVVEQLDGDGLHGAVVDAAPAGPGRPGSARGSRGGPASRSAPGPGPPGRPGRPGSPGSAGRSRPPRPARVEVRSSGRKGSGQASGSSAARTSATSATCSGPVSSAGRRLPVGQVVAVGLEQAEGEGVEGGGRDGGVGAPQAGRHPGAQVGRPAPGEGQQQHLLGAQAGGVDEVDRPAHQELGLARARPGHHQLRAVDGGDGGVPVAGIDPGLGERLQPWPHRIARG